MKRIKAITLSEEIIEFVEKFAQREHRNFSNSIETIIRRYREISKGLI